MKNIFFLILLFIFNNSFSQINIKTIDFNISNDSLKSIDLNQFKIKINDYIFSIDDEDFQFENNKLIEYSYNAYSKPLLDKFDSYYTTLLLQSINDFFISLNYKNIYKSKYYPTPKLLIGEKAILIYKKENIYFIVNIPSCILYSETYIYEIKLIVTNKI